MPDKPLNLAYYLQNIPDPRIDRTKLHDLTDILVLSVCAVICGAEGWKDIAEFGKAKEDWLKGFLKLENGIPSHDTINRVFSLLDGEAFETCFLEWIKSLGKLEGQVAIDGKTLRHSYDKHHKKRALHLVNVWASQSGLMIGQMKTASKSNEITAIPKLLKMLEIAGCLVSIDAMGCQKVIASQIVEQDADYLLAVKKNQKGLYTRLKETFGLEFEQKEPFQGFEHDYARTVEKNRGRIETRECWTITDPALLEYADPKQEWANLRTIAFIRSRRVEQGKETVLECFYISSAEASASTLLQAKRCHWEIENKCHWVLDVVFREDDARMRAGHSAHNFAILRQIALNLLRSETSKRSIRAKRLKAGWDDQFLLNVLFALN